MWQLGGAPLLIFVIGAGMVAFISAVSWVAFRTRGTFALATSLAGGTLVLAAVAWWRGMLTNNPLAGAPFQIAAAVTIGSGLVVLIGEIFRGRKGPGEKDEEDSE
jgi:hypothetical protein